MPSLRHQVLIGGWGSDHAAVMNSELPADYRADAFDRSVFMRASPLRRLPVVDR